MTIAVDQRIAELLCSRICHELVAGIAAINNGVELISEIDPSMFDEAMGLIGTSGKQASARLQYYRMAYGFAGYEALGGIAAVNELIEGLLETEERFSADLSADSPPLEAGWGKLLLNLTVLGMDCLPRGGTLRPAVVSEGGKTVVSVRGEGDEARLSDHASSIVDATPSSDEVTALNVHAYYTAALADAVGGGISVAFDGGRVSIEVAV